MVQTRLLDASDAALDAAAAMLRAGQLVAMPTETVYGLAGDATDDHAVAAIYAAKGRPSFNPLIAHVVDLDMARSLVEMPGPAGDLAAAFWPGPLTLVLPLKPGARVSALVTAGLPTLAIRIPAHPLARGLIARVGRPLAAPSANPSGRISPTEAQHVVDGLGGRIAAVLDGGPCRVGVESTIVAVDAAGAARLLRPGGIPAAQIAACLGQDSLTQTEADGSGIESPGQMLSHYAPRGTLRLNASAPRPGETYLGFGPDSGRTSEETGLNLSPAGDLTEAAANLFRLMHVLDDRGADSIAVAPIPETGLGQAINDRLRRAAAPRD
ncbi:L-threonylcarbamoyladenylate synthase [Pseudooceanicola algae]|uniref:Threonylcarbamoyl-AMP synthase n=1 Tax=Pseudooceanicola algae TaxID=1537215 RepID=A0A418SKG9_9RHOB|nr:L-threonylcarbamoyladenylate synthase [Pseudooceanicola algae]QPM90713.1 Threonylcarbamoyl-AMP synthase [Pseudooceanicola algae]